MGATTADATININIQTVVYRGAACEILATAKNFERFGEAKVFYKLPTQDLRISHKKLPLWPLQAVVPLTKNITLS